MKKSAFTLPEILIAMAIIGIVVTFGLKASLQNDKGIRYIYSNTYHVLDRALYNATHYPTNPDPFDNNITGRNGNGETITTDEGTKRLCLMLTEYINTVEPNPCNASGAVGSRPARADSSQRLISDTANDTEFTADMVQFTATNGVRYFISRRMPYEGINSSRGLQPGDSTFFLIFADVNGTKFPNSMRYISASDINHRKKSVDPDIFAFAAMDFGRVVPLGPPEFDGRFMLSRIMYYNTENNRNNDDSIFYSRPSQPYYLMKAQAWGYYNANSDISDTEVIEENPYSYNGYIKSKLNPNSQIYSFVSNYFDTSGNVKKVPANANIKSNNVSQGGYGCVTRTDEECNVIIDKYVF